MTISLTYIIIGITVATSFYAFSNRAIIHNFTMSPYLISTRKEFYRFITSGFLHNDHIHLLFNMMSLYFFGGMVEYVFRSIFGPVMGGVYYVVLYLLAIVVADVPTYFKQRHNPGYHALGASGGVSAVIFASIVFQPLERICLYFAICIPGFILGTLYLIYSYFQGKQANDGVNHDAHLYGAIFGVVFCAVLVPKSLPLFVEQIKAWNLF